MLWCIVTCTPSYHVMTAKWLANRLANWQSTWPSTYPYVRVCTSLYQYVLSCTMSWYVPLWYVLLCTSMYWYALVYLIFFFEAGLCSSHFDSARQPTAADLWGNTDNTSCQAPEVCPLQYVLVCTSTYWYVLVCTGMYLYHIYFWQHAHIENIKTVDNLSNNKDVSMCILRFHARAGYLQHYETLLKEIDLHHDPTSDAPP